MKTKKPTRHKTAAGKKAKNKSKSQQVKRKKTGLDRLEEIVKRAESAANRIEKRQPAYGPGRTPGKLFGFGDGQAPGVIRQRGERPYSFAKAAALASGKRGPDECQEEFQLHEKLRAEYMRGGFIPNDGASLIIPYAVDYLPTETSRQEKLAQEVREKCQIRFTRDDFNQAKRLARGDRKQLKALSTLSETTGGSWIDGPQVMGIVDLLRNNEIFSKAGATEIGLAPNGRMSLGKLTSGATSYSATELQDQSGNVSTQGTGSLFLEAKTIITLCQLTNQFLAFSNAGAEMMVRMDMARSAALKGDYLQLYGVGGQDIKGLLTYETASSWSQGTDKLLLYAPTGGTDGWTMQPEDVDLMEGLLPDEVEASAWIMRKQFFSRLINRRADGPVTGDGKGQFLFQRYIQQQKDKKERMFNGSPALLSSQIKNNLSKGASSGILTEVLTGYFPDWVIARFGIAELTPNAMASGAYFTNSTYLRLITYMDAGARHASSFVWFTNLLNQ